MVKKESDREDKIEMLEVALDITANGEHLDMDRASLEHKVAQLGVGQTAEIVAAEETPKADERVRFVDFGDTNTDK